MYTNYKLGATAFLLMLVFSFSSCIKDKTSKWDNTKWSFDVDLHLAADDLGDSFSGSLPSSMTLYVNDAEAGEFISDWDVLDRMELRPNGDLYFPINQSTTIMISEDDGYSTTTNTGYCLITLISDKEAAGDIEYKLHTVNNYVDGIISFNGYLHGSRIK